MFVAAVKPETCGIIKSQNHLYMIPRITTTGEKKLIGKQLTMSLLQNRTVELWSSFMPLRKHIQNSISTDLYSMQVYNAGYFNQFDAGAFFVKWAAIEVTDHEIIPEGLEAFTLPAGLYAVFQYKGMVSGAPAFFQYIFNTWLPGSGYILDDRPHFELLGERYSNESPDSEEEVWIPVRLK
jgi:AraC family transcriptional regulator